MVATAASIRAESPCSVNRTISLLSFFAEPARLYSMACFMTRARKPTSWSLPVTVAETACCIGALQELTGPKRFHLNGLSFVRVIYSDERETTCCLWAKMPTSGGAFPAARRLEFSQKNGEIVT